MASDLVGVCPSAGGFKHQTAFKHHRNAIGNIEQLVKILADQQHRGPRITRGDDLRANLACCRKIEAEAGVLRDKKRYAFRQLARQHQALHIATGKGFNRSIHARGLDAIAANQTLCMSIEHVPAHEPPCCIRRNIEDAQCKIVRDRHGAHTGVAQRFLGEKVHTARAHFAPRAAIRRSPDAHLAAFGNALPGQHLHQLALSIA